MARPENKPNPLPSKEFLNMVLSYSENTGELTWRKRDPSSFSPRGIRSPEALSRHWNSSRAGKSAGHERLTTGYIALMLDGVSYQAHRVIWKMVNGGDPVAIDHINGNKKDNRISNLRDVSHQVNSKNRKLYANNKSGVNGVSYHERDKVWTARISVGGSKDVHLGNFKTMGEAVAARIAAEIVLDYHPNHGSRAELVES